MAKRNTFAEGYQEALGDVARIIENPDSEDVLADVLAYLQNNAR